MDFLRPMFHNEINDTGAELDEYGVVIVAGQRFLPQSILRDLAPSAYELAFNEWIEERKDRLLEKADEILTQYDNGYRFEQLRRAFRNGSMIPFIGAGMSVGSGFPTWTRFLYDLCNESHVSKDELDQLLTAGEYEQAAQKLYEDLGAGLFNENLESVFSREKDPSGPINYLPLLFPNTSVFTTNFDRVIERVYASNGEYQGFDRAQSGKVLAELSRLLSSGERLLVKIHGDCRQVADRVLLESEYDDAYSQQGNVQTFFDRILFGKSLLFLGCSLTTDRTITTMKKIVHDSGAASLPRHYAILELRDDDDRIARKKHLSEANIFPIWYAKGEHDESIEALFLKLLEE